MSTLTISNNTTFGQKVARFILRLLGWRISGEPPKLSKYILVGAPHTSNWDFIYTMLFMVGSGVRFNWVGKASLFKKPFGAIFLGLGGIPVLRDRSTNFVSQIVKAFEQKAQMVIAIAPEGTRSLVTYWKTGFYYMALGAKVPIVMGFVDYKEKEVGFGPLLHPSGDIEADFALLRQFYSTKWGKFPEKQGKIEIKPAS
jgi:1-acyl-sn-glycerol-3-phosphate acyltransferase